MLLRMEKDQNTYALLMEMKTGTAIMENSMAIPYQK